jgi:hypothetical protein
MALNVGEALGGELLEGGVKGVHLAPLFSKILKEPQLPGNTPRGIELAPLSSVELARLFIPFFRG